MELQQTRCSEPNIFEGVMQVLGVDRRVHIFETVKPKIKENGYFLSNYTLIWGVGTWGKGATFNI